MITPKRTPYLTNKDLMREIHRSKNTYCSYLLPEDHQFDLILPSLTKINQKTIAEAKRARADRMAKQAWESSQLAGIKTKLDDHAVDYRKIKKHEVVFRIITWDHIPLAPGRKKTPKTSSDLHTKVNFPPFQHYRFDELTDELICVGKSHWMGGLQNGHFNKDHGKMTSNLARMFIKLCERYGSKGNWRGYTYNDEMRSQALLQLSQVGLQFDESKSNNPFAYYTATITNSFTRVLNVEKRNQHLRDDILEMNSLNPSYTRQTENAIKAAESHAQATITIVPDSEPGFVKS
jgi:hypothetical protein